MAWQTVLSIEGQVRGFSQEGRRTQPSSLDSGCIRLNSAWGQRGILLGGQRLAWLSKGQRSKVLTTGTQGQKVGSYLASLCLVDPTQAACS